MSDSRPEAVALRMAAAEWSEHLHDDPKDARDSKSLLRDRKLQRAAVKFAAAPAKTKRGYSRAFTPKTDRRVRLEIDRIPPTLMDAVKSKARREGISLRALTLTLWKEWSER